MPRRRRTEQEAVGTLPELLRDPDSPAWESGRDLGRLLALPGLQLGPAAVGPASRYRAAAWAWARANGATRRVGGATVIDYRRLRDLGFLDRPQAALRERLGPSEVPLNS